MRRGPNPQWGVARQDRAGEVGGSLSKETVAKMDYGATELRLAAAYPELFEEKAETRRLTRGPFLNYLVQSTGAHAMAMKDVQRMIFEEGYVETAPGELTSPDGKTTVLLG